MKKINLKKLQALSKKEFWNAFGIRLKLSLRGLPKTLFIKHSHAIDVISVTLVLVLAGYLVLALFYFTPSDIEADSNSQQKLSVDLLDRLNLWVEERGHEKQRPLNLSDDKLFERIKTTP